MDEKPFWTIDRPENDKFERRDYFDNSGSTEPYLLAHAIRNPHVRRGELHIDDRGAWREGNIHVLLEIVQDAKAWMEEERKDWFREYQQLVRTPHRWWDAQDALPGDGMLALLRLEDGSHAVGHYSELNGWFYGTSHKLKITHWMEIPRLPA